MADGQVKVLSPCEAGEMGGAGGLWEGGLWVSSQGSAIVSGCLSGECERASMRDTHARAEGWHGSIRPWAPVLWQLLLGVGEAAEL